MTAKRTYSDSVKFPLGNDWYFSVFRCDTFVNMSIYKWTLGKNGTLYVNTKETGINMIRPQYNKFLESSDDILQALDSSCTFDDKKFDLLFNLSLTLKSGYYDQTSCNVVLENSYRQRVIMVSSDNIKRLIELKDQIGEQILILEGTEEPASKKRKIDVGSNIISIKTEPDEAEKLYLLVSGTFLRYKAASDLKCAGCEVEELSQHKHECMMILESIRIGSEVESLVANLIEYKLKIREMFARTAVIEMIPDLSSVFVKLHMCEDKFLGTNEGKQKVKDKACEVSDIIHSIILSEDYECINKITEICMQ